MISKTDIFNLAKIRVAHKESASIGSKDRGNELCELVYDFCLRSALSEREWNFAVKYIELAQTGEPPQNWGYSYAVPVDCIKALEVVIPGLRRYRVDQRIQYEIGSNDENRMLYCDESSVSLKYISLVEDTSVFSDCFTDALIWKISSEIALPLSGKPEIAQSARDAYVLSLYRAGAINANEGWRGVQPNGEFLSSYSCGD